MKGVANGWPLPFGINSGLAIVPLLATFLLPRIDLGTLGNVLCSRPMLKVHDNNFSIALVTIPT